MNYGMPDEFEFQTNNRRLLFRFVASVSCVIFGT